MNNEASREYKTVDGSIFEQVTVGTEYITSKRSDERITIYWSSSLDILKTMAMARHTLGEPIAHMNGSAVFRDPETDRPFSADHHVPTILNWVNKLPEHTDNLQLPHDGMAVGWARVPEEFRDTMTGPSQLRVTAEQQIARAAIYRLLLESGSPAITRDLDKVLAVLEYDFKPLALGESKRSSEWLTMHQPTIELSEQHAA